jgi:hypothetical protein
MDCLNTMTLKNYNNNETNRPLDHIVFGHTAYGKINVAILQAFLLVSLARPISERHLLYRR